MDAWIDFARGPLFRISLTIMILGLGYRIGVAAAQIWSAWNRAADRRLPIREIAAATLGWLVPLRLLRSRPLYSTASFLFHVGIILVPLFLAGHVALLEGVLPAGWPRLDPLLADALTVLCAGALVALVVGRLVVTTARQLSRTHDVVILFVLLLTVVLGFLAGHPTMSPFAARSMVLLHILCGNLVLVLIPATKIAHCVLYPLTQLLFQLGWHFPAETGRHVAIALDKENEPV
jgi:nitrate reductase gamma subunit